MNRNGTPPNYRIPLWAAASFLLVSLVPAAAFAVVPPVPIQPNATCATDPVNTSGKCYVNGNFTLTSSSPGAHHYHVCRSEDTLGWGGCDDVFATFVGSVVPVSAPDVPSDGFRRAYRFKACDAADNCTTWSANTPVYVYMDTTAPSAPGPTTTDPICPYEVGGTCWMKEPFDIWVTPATDSGSGVNPSGYKICRSVDHPLNDFAGCNVTMQNFSIPSAEVDDPHLPTDGNRRSYWFRARDWVGNLGPWNTPRYVRVDRHDPTVSANNASSATFYIRTATVTATDTTGGAAANSGLKEVRYRWNDAHNASCTTGTATTAGGVINVPEGDNTLYLCAKDNTGRVGFWSGGPYRVHECPNPNNIVPVACSASSASVALTSKAALASELEIQQGLDEALIGYALEPIDPAQMRRELDATGKLTLRLNGTPYELVLAATDLQALSYRTTSVTAFGKIEGTRGPVSTFTGHVSGVPGSDVRLLVHPELLMGYVEIEGKRFFIEPAYRFVPGGGTSRVVIYQDGDLRPEAGIACAATELRQRAPDLGGPFLGEAVWFEKGARGAGLVKSGLRVVELATDADYEYYTLHRSDESMTNQYIQGVLNMVNGFYDEAGLVFGITYQRVFTNPSTDPYETCHVHGQWCELWREWQNHQTAVHRDVVHLFSGKALYSSTGTRIRGTSGLGGTVCDLERAYVNSTPYREVGLVAHEIGHALGAMHVDHQVSPPGSVCPDTDCGDADVCPDPDPAGGPVMCGHIQEPITGHHQISINEIMNFVNSSGACLMPQ